MIIHRIKAITRSLPSRREGLLLLFLATGIGITLLSSCGKEYSVENGDGSASQGTLTLNLQHTVKNFILNTTDQYTTDYGETYRVSTFKYYLHNITLRKGPESAVVLSPGYFLVDEAAPASKILSFKVPAGSYTALQFTLGVDSADNVSGAQTGALDPLNGMFWTWTTGYVMAKLEGTSPFVTGATNEFSYHVGGFKAPYSVIKTITLPAGLTIKKDSAITISMDADINTWFSHASPLKLSETSACHAPGELAKKIADNYEGMFYITNIE